MYGRDYFWLSLECLHLFLNSLGVAPVITVHECYQFAVRKGQPKILREVGATVLLDLEHPNSRISISQRE